MNESQTQTSIASMFIEKAIEFLALSISKTLAKKIVCCLFLVVGVEISRCAELVKLNVKTIRKYKKSLDSGNIDELFISGGGGRKSSLFDYESVIVEEIESGEYHTQQEIADMAFEKTGVRVSISSIKRLLKKHGIKLYKSASLPAKADPELQREFYEYRLLPLMKASKKEKIGLGFMDPSHFVMGGSYMGSVYSKQRRYVKTYAQSKRLSFIGSLCYNSNTMLYTTTTSSVNSVAIIDFLIQLANDQRDMPIHLVLDNASYNTAQAVKDAAQTLDITLHYLPTYSPNLNLIERIWRFMKGKLRRKYYAKFMEFKETIIGIAESTTNECKHEIETLISEKFQLFDDLVPVSDISYIRVKDDDDVA